MSLWHSRLAASLAIAIFASSLHPIALGSLQTSPPAVAAADSALQHGRIGEASALLRSILGAQPQDAQAHQLFCRVYYAQDMADEAIHECELAVAAARSSSDNHLWLGRAYGMKAARIGLSSLGFARRVRDEFERAAQLDPMAPRASSDLCQFYISAPGIAGGDVARAQAIITRLEPQFPVYSHRLRAMLAEQNQDYVTAEAEFKSAIVSGAESSANGPTAAAWIDLARFYRERKQPDQAVAAIQSGLALSPQDAVLVDAAGILTAAHRSPELAEQLLRQYLKSPAQTDEAPAFKVHLQLGGLLAHRGDAAGARVEYTQAITLAPDYEPARKALRNL